MWISDLGHDVRKVHRATAGIHSWNFLWRLVNQQLAWVQLSVSSVQEVDEHKNLIAEATPQVVAIDVCFPLWLYGGHIDGLYNNKPREESHHVDK